jgi:hypothetical protein
MDTQRTVDGHIEKEKEKEKEKYTRRTVRTREQPSACDPTPVDHSPPKTSDTTEASPAKKGVPMPPECREQLSRIFGEQDASSPGGSETLPWERERPKDPHAEAERLLDQARRLKKGGPL